MRLNFLLTVTAALAWGAAVAAPVPERAPLAPEEVELVRVADLSGLEVVDQESGAVGSVEYLTLSLGHGRLSDLIVATPQGDLLVVPWTTVRVDEGAPPIMLAATARQIENAPRLTRQQLAALAQPEAAAHVREYWAPAEDLAAWEGPAAGRADVPDAGPGPEAPQARDEEDRLVLAGSEIVVSIMAPVLEVDEALRGSTVHAGDGQEVGVISEIVIDPEAGVAAFAVIEGERGRAAVPVQVLSWTAVDSVVLRADPALLRRDRELVEQDLVNRQSLVSLYERFDVAAPW